MSAVVDYKTMQCRYDSIMTASGGEFKFLDPDGSEVLIDDIAHALSHLCRYGGHCMSFYSVAEHSVLCSRIVPREHALTALLHDAAEAYLGDIPRPLKKLLPDYRALQYRVEKSILQRFNLPFPLPAEVRKADDDMLWLEMRVLMPDGHEQWMNRERPEILSTVGIYCWPPESARKEFIGRYLELTYPA